MNIVAADWLPYALPLKRPWQTARGVMTQREGRLLCLTAADDRIGWGDAAPLPEFGIDAAMAAAFAEDCAQLDLLAQRADLPLNAWLSGEAPRVTVAVNSVLGAISKVSVEQLRTAHAAGYRVAKLKVGVLPVAEEIARLRELCAEIRLAPTQSAEGGNTGMATLRLRLDANLAWSMADVQAFIDACVGLPVEGLEEPLAEPSAATLAELQRQAPFPLAVDESIELLTPHFFRHPPVRRLVLKPARHGLLASVELALRARASGIEVVVTSALESACGLLACAHLAAAVAPDSVHGLGTADWLAADTGDSPRIVEGHLHLPQEAGIGFHPFGA
ncbi:o-succinylbenzoate synthase [Azonexus sp. IMCC34839]|uniref:o-succinylbenzoate synthase n=1 Tax=Azonexus sp. IMCC34839 TaxID=3133695 RepID=UPI00399A8518